MKRVALVVTAVVIAAALAIATHSTPMPSSSATSTPPLSASAAPRVSRSDVDAQHDQVTAAERGRIGRTRLLDATLVTAAVGHGVSITTGTARPSDRAPQDMVVTPAPDLTVREIADAVSHICSALQDPCERRDYRFLIQTQTGQALLPARLIHPKD